MTILVSLCPASLYAGWKNKFSFSHCLTGIEVKVYLNMRPWQYLESFVLGEVTVSSVFTGLCQSLFLFSSCSLFLLSDWWRFLYDYKSLCEHPGTVYAMVSRSIWLTLELLQVAADTRLRNSFHLTMCQPLGWFDRSEWLWIQQKMWLQLVGSQSPD